MIQAVIFDFDGVILESAEIKTGTFKRMFSQHTEFVNEIVDYHKQNMGIARFVKFKHIYENILKRPYTAEDEKRLGQQFSSQTLQAVLEAPFVPGALTFLQQFSAKYLCFIASGTPQEELLDIIEKRSLKHFFKEVHGSPRSKSEIVKDLLTRYRLKPAAVVFIGDAETDRRAAAETGIHFLGRSADGREFGQKVRVIPDLTNLISALQGL